jgi:hypothetical protein
VLGPQIEQWNNQRLLGLEAQGRQRVCLIGGVVASLDQPAGGLN